MPRAKHRLAQAGAIALLAFAPKCLMCALAYAGLFGLGGAELCGEAPAGWPQVMSVAAGALGAAGFLLHRLGQRVTSPVFSR